MLVDEFPSRAQSLPVAMQTGPIIAELGTLILTSRASGDGSAAVPGLRRHITTTEPRDSLMADQAALRITSVWQKVTVAVPKAALGLPLHWADLLWIGHIGVVLSAGTLIGRIGFGG